MDELDCLVPRVDAQRTKKLFFATNIVEQVQQQKVDAMYDACKDEIARQKAVMEEREDEPYYEQYDSLDVFFERYGKDDLVIGDYKVNIGDKLGAGCFRAGFDVGCTGPDIGMYTECVVKIALSASGAEQNKQEYEFYQRVKHMSWAKHLPHVYAVCDNGYMLLVEKVPALKTLDVPHRVYEAIRDLLQEKVPPFTSDWNQGNIGVCEAGIPRLIDFGFHSYGCVESAISICESFKC